MLIAAIDMKLLIPILASAAMGAGVFVFVLWILLALESEDAEQADEWRYDISRINELRRVDVTYRLFQPIIQFFARINRGALRGSMVEMQRELQAAGQPRCWLAEEYLGRAELVALMLMPLYIYMCLHWFDAPGIFLGPVLSLATVWFLRRRLRVQARNRLQQIKRRMPFLLDLLTLLMEAGSTFLLALQQAVDQYSHQAVGVEFGRVLMDMNLGKPRMEAFRAMRERLRDDEITSIIGAIIQGEELGTPLARIFRTQADVLRLKRSQRAEAVAGEAGVNMLLPGVLVMMSTILVILGPFLLNYLYSGL
jgi:tight adherence protein C